MPLIRSANLPSPHSVLYFQWQNNWAVREGDWKLIGKRGNRPDVKETVTLHHLAGDEPERVDYSGQEPQVAARLRKLHDEWIEAVSAGSDE